MRRATWTSTLVAAVAASLLWSSSGIAADNVPIVSNLKAHPKRFCAKRTSSCRHVGTKVTFDITTRAHVRIDVVPRSGPPRWGMLEVNRSFPAGSNMVHIRDSRLTPGPWEIRIQGRNHVGSGPIQTTIVRVVKHD